MLKPKLALASPPPPPHHDGHVQGRRPAILQEDLAAPRASRVTARTLAAVL